ncbi:MAG: N-acetyl-gamma-glutamyl-phosphate reductase [Elusimicrobiota bacterium]
MIRVSILGATGYSGGELIRLLLNHPFVKIQHLTSESSVGQPIEAVHPELRGRLKQLFEKIDIKTISQDSDVVFSCYPAAVGIKPNSQLIRAGVKVIDLSGDFRLPNTKMYEEWYKEKHTAPELLKKAVYGLPELFKQAISKARLIANPGCYATAASLSIAPLLLSQEGSKPVIDPASIIVDAKSGVSGAGKKVSSNYMFCEVDGNLKAYSVAVHRHQPEIESVLFRFSAVKPIITFSPHLIPMNRGILSLTYATLIKSFSTKDLRSLFENFYKGKPFVRLLPEGELPETKNVNYSNYCDIGITQDKRTKRIVVVSALDNLGKGAASQAIQNMNICSGRPETEGLI